MRERTRLSFRAIYTLLLGGSVLSALQSITPPLYTWPSVADLVVNVTVLLWLASGRHAWATGAPEYTTSRKMPLASSARMP